MPTPGAAIVPVKPSAVSSSPKRDIEPPRPARPTSSPDDIRDAGAEETPQPARAASAPPVAGVTTSAAHAEKPPTLNPLLPYTRPVGLSAVFTRKLNETYAAAAASPSDATKVGRLGMLYLNVQAPVEATACLERAASLEPKVVRWWYYLAYAYQEQFNVAKTIDALRQAIAADEKYAGAHLMLADTLMTSNAEAARSAYAKAASLNPADARSQFGLGQCARKAGKLAEAVERYQKAVQLAPSYSAAHGALAEALRESGRDSEARVHAQRALRPIPPPIIGDPLYVELVNLANTSAALIQEAEGRAEKGELRQATELLESAVSRGEADAAIRNALGILLSKQGRYEEGMRQFAKVLDAEPTRTETRSNFAFALQRQGRFRQAEEMFRSLLDDYPDDHTSLQLYGLMLLERGRAREGLAQFRRLAELNPSDAERQLDLAVAALCAGERDAGLDAYAAYLRAGDSQSDRGGRLAIRLVKMLADQRHFPVEDTRQASLLTLDSITRLADPLSQRGFQKDASLARSAAELLVTEALAWADRGQFEHASRILEIGEKTDQSGQIQGALGTVLMLQHRFDEAVPHLRRAVSQDPKQVMAVSNLAECLARQKQNEEAERLFREAIKQDPKHVMSLRRLGVLLGRSGRPDEALGLIRQCDALDPGAPANQYCLADILGQKGETEEALKLVRQLPPPAAAPAETHYALGELLNRLGDNSAAEREWREAIRLRPTFIGTYLAMEAAALKRKDYAAAKKALSLGLAEVPESAVLRNNLAHILATCPAAQERNPEEALRLARLASQFTENANHQILDTLAICLAATGQFREAADTERKAISLAQQAGAQEKEAEFRKRLALFESGKAFYLEN